MGEAHRLVSPARVFARLFFIFDLDLKNSSLILFFPRMFFQVFILCWRARTVLAAPKFV
jgi:hypothetical protein